MNDFNFSIQEELAGTLARAGEITTPHGAIQTPAFITVGTKATVKAVLPEQVKELGAQAVLANTYHLYLKPGSDIVREMGGLHKFMNWNGPTFTDSGGFQVFSLGEAYGKGVSKIASGDDNVQADKRPVGKQLAKVDDEGVTFRSHIDGSTHRLTPEKSMQIQHDLGADIIFAFDECTSPQASYEYQKEALERTHAWAARSLSEHQRLGISSPEQKYQALFGIVQGGRHQDLRRHSAEVIGAMDFDGFGIGGSFNKDDMPTAVRWVNEILPKDKPRHLLGIGEPLIFGVTLPLGKPFIGACLGGAVGGALISYWKVATVITFGISGLPLALTIVAGKVMFYLLGYLVAVIAGFLFTWLLGFTDPEE